MATNNVTKNANETFVILNNYQYLSYSHYWKNVDGNKTVYCSSFYFCNLKAMAVDVDQSKKDKQPINYEEAVKLNTER